MSRRRARGPAARRAVVERAAQCPDCLSDVRLRWQAGGLTRVEVRHDAGCPWHNARGGGSFTEFRVLASGALR